MLSISANLAIPDDELQFTFSRSSGPGGQNVNKVNSKATLRWNVRASASLPEGVKQRFTQKFGSRLTKEGELLLVSQEYRDQPKNIQACLDRLREMILLVLIPPKKRRPTKPTRGSKIRTLEAKHRRSQTKANRRVRDE